jgi:microcystin-dependent protein
MATVTGLTAARMLEIEAGSVVDGEVVSGNLILTKHDGTTIDAGPVLGPAGPVGPVGPASISAIPGEIKLWPGGALPELATYGRWAWADGAVYVIATYPVAASHIAAQWRTFAGASDPGASNFRVPDLRGVVPAGMDAMPGGARANRMTRAIAITIAGKTGEETHVITVPEMAAHGHGVNDPGHGHGINDPGHRHPLWGGVRGSGGYLFFDVGSNYIYKESGVDAGSMDLAGTGITINGGATGVSIQNNGGGGGHENVQPTIFVPYIVKLDD